MAPGHSSEPVSEGLSFTNALTLLTILALSAVLLYGFYNVFLHPLARYPGPKLWTAYRLPCVVNNIQGQLPFKVLELHRKYNSAVVRIAPAQLSFTDPEAWQDIYGLQNGRIQNRKDLKAYTPPSSDAANGIIHANDVVHARLRKIYGPAFTPKAVEEQSGMLLKYADQLVEQLGKAVKANPIQDMSTWFNSTTFDLTGDFAFGEAFHCLDRGGENHFFMKTVFDGVVRGLQMQQLDHYGIFTLLKPLIPKFMMKPKEDMDRYTQELVDRRMGKGFMESRTDMLNYLLSNKNPDDQLSRSALYENGITLVVAGSETTATLLTGTLPEEFIPERWLPDAPPGFRNDRREVLQPSMVGLRGCLGKSLAYAEMRLLLAKALWHFDCELADPTEDWYAGLKA